MHSSHAFTLIELVVSIGIISLISAVVFFNAPQLNETVALNRATRELTLALREAQTRAIAVTSLPDGSSPKNYGVYVSGTPTAEGNGQFLIFSDTNNNLKYDGGSSADPLIKTITFTRGIQITGFNLGGVTNVGGAHFIYYRPGPQMIVSDGGGNCVSGSAGNADFSNGRNDKCAADPSGDNSTLNSYGPFKMEISRPAGVSPGIKRTIEVWRTGQISIK